MKKRLGFTMFETLVSISILLVLTTLVVVYAGRGFETDVNVATGQVVQVLSEARERTLASRGDQAWGVNFDSTTYTLFPAAFSNCPTGCEEHALSDGVEFGSVSVGGGNDVLFQRLTGATAQPGTVVVRQIEDNTRERTIRILSSGEVGQAGTVTPTNTRITDYRHVHVDLGWSMQGASNLEFDFDVWPGTCPTVIIPMSEYFDPTQTEFSYEGTVDGCDSNETFVITTHTLNASDTILSIHRDRRFNSVPVTLSIDGQEIAVYDDSNVATVGLNAQSLTIQ